MAEIKLTPREQQVYAVLSDHPQSASQIAHAANLRTTWPAETAARYCTVLAKKGVALKGPDGFSPTWKRAAPPSPQTGA